MQYTDDSPRLRANSGNGRFFGGRMWLRLSFVASTVAAFPAVLFHVGVAVIQAQQQSHPHMNESIYPLQLIPVSSTTVGSSYAMWTPMNWTATSTVPTLQYSAYLVSTTNSQSFRVLVPCMTPDFATTTRSRVVNNNGNAVRIRRHDKSTRPFIDCEQRNSVAKFHATTTTNKSNCIRNSNVLLQRTTEQSKNHHCQYAMNGGPFNSNGSSVGVVMVQNGTFASTDFGPNIGFGIARKPTLPNGTALASYWVVGRLNNITQTRTLGMEQFVSGFDWLVYNYSNIALYRNNTTGAIRASRSAIGITADGILLLLVTDGCEHCFRHQGMTLTELADLFLSFGAQYAINMDGGSSSVMVHPSKTILNQPTCYYNAIVPRNWVPCERSVSSVICLS